MLLYKPRSSGDEDTVDPEGFLPVYTAGLRIDPEGLVLTVRISELLDELMQDLAERFSGIAQQYDEKHTSEENTIYNACASLVIELAAPRPDDVVLDLGAGAGVIALALAEDAGHVVGRDISEGMIEQARSKAADNGVENVEFGYGEFSDPHYDGDIDIVVSNFALHHLPDEQKREAIEAIADLSPRRFVLGDAMFFGSPDPDEPLFGRGVDGATVGMLVDFLTDVGFAVTTVERVHEQVGVLVAEQVSPLRRD